MTALGGCRLSVSTGGRFAILTLFFTSPGSAIC